MTDKIYKRATEIQRKIEDLYTIRRIAFQPFIRFYLIKKFLWISDDVNKVSICDKGLKDVIVKYCDERIEELKKELEAL